MGSTPVDTRPAMFKIIVALFLFAALSSAKPTEPVGCQMCRDAIMVLFNDFTTDNSIMGQKWQLEHDVCPSMPETNGCSAAIESWWGKIARVIFSDTGAAHVCFALDHQCALSPLITPKEWNCEICQKRVVDFINLM